MRKMSVAALLLVITFFVQQGVVLAAPGQTGGKKLLKYNIKPGNIKHPVKK